MSGLTLLTDQLIRIASRCMARDCHNGVRPDPEFAGQWQKCPTCKGRGSVLTEDGKRLVAFLGQHFAATDHVVALLDDLSRRMDEMVRDRIREHVVAYKQEPWEDTES